MSKLRVVQFGTGPMVHSLHHTIALGGLPETYELLGIIEENPILRARAEKIPEFAKYPFLTFEQARRLDPDAFLVETEEHSLVPTAIRVLEAGYHTYLDKPGSESSADFHRMCELAQKKNLVLSMAYMFRHNPAILDAMQLKKEGKLGEIFAFEGQMSCGMDRGYRETLPRFKGGMLYYLGCHLIDQMVAFCGFPEEVIPLNACTGIDVDCIDFGMCAYRYKNGVSFVKTTACEKNGFNRRQIVITGSEGTMEIRPLEQACGNNYNDTFARVTLDDRNIYADGSVVRNYPPQRRYDGLLLDFAAFVNGEKVNPYSYEFEARLHDLILQSCGYTLQQGTMQTASACP